MKRIDGMPPREPAQSWLAVYVAFAAVVGLLWLERHASLTSADHTIALLTIVAIFFVVTWWWLTSGEKR